MVYNPVTENYSTLLACLNNIVMMIECSAWFGKEWSVSG
jgi:hypothetical protein